MFRVAALVPTPPLLVPELMGARAAETADLRAAAVDAMTPATSMVDRWLAIGVDRIEKTYDETTVGTFRGFGVDVVVSLSGATVSTEPDPELPLAVLIAGWLRGAAVPGSAVEVRTIPAGANTRWCAQFGAELRRELDSSAENWGVLVLADGANTLTAKAPGSFDDRAEQVQQRIDDALAAADVGSLAGLDPELCASVGAGGRAAWQVLAALAGTDAMTAKELYRGAPFGVGYFVGTWSRA
ncbi:MAG: class III extradiol dioxygenase subunit B-like domain-containing protein [Rhodococcus sp. (in: high G+C Gram-positive bacteria)]